MMELASTPSYREITPVQHWRLFVRPANGIIWKWPTFSSSVELE
jgi:hypothetical protein